MALRNARLSWLESFMLVVLLFCAVTASARAASATGEPAASGVSTLQLVMFEQAGCGWCEQWTRDIGGIYDKSDEGRRAPLRRVDIHAPLPADLAFLKSGKFTPTFVLVADGREIGRIRGYPGPDWFWPLLGELLQRAGGSGKSPGANAAGQVN